MQDDLAADGAGASGAVSTATPQRPVSRHTHSRASSVGGAPSRASFGVPPSPSSKSTPPRTPPSDVEDGGGDGGGHKGGAWATKVRDRAAMKRLCWRLCWLGLGFRDEPSADVMRLLAAYALSASVMLSLNKHVARTDRIDAVLLVQLQLGGSLAVIWAAKLAGKIDLTLSVTKGGPHELYAWMALSVAFAVQLVASVRTLQTHHVTEWYMLLHYLTPCAVPLIERHLPAVIGEGEQPPLRAMVVPVLTLCGATVWSYSTAGVFGPGTTEGASWSLVWISARITSLVGSRAAILTYGTPVWNRLLYQTLGAFTVFATITMLVPSIVETTWAREQSEPLSMPRVLLYMLVALSCVMQLAVAWARLDTLGKTTASTFAIVSSVGVFPARLYYQGYRLLDANPH